MSNPLAVTLHKDGTITYFSMYEQVWRKHTPFINDAELAAMGAKDRERVQKHMLYHGVTVFEYSE